MENFHHILNELKDAAPAVANLDKINPYQVPEGYFSSLTEKVLHHVMMQTSPESSFSFSKEETYSVPVGYFESLSVNILNKIKLSDQKSEVYLELEQAAPLLNTIEKVNPYTVPAYYFTDLTIDVSQQSENKPARVVSLQSSLKRWVTYAAAASILFIMATGSYMYVNHHLKSVDRSLTVGQRLASLKDEDIMNYLQNDLGDADPVAPALDNDPDVNHLLINASDEEIEHYLDTDSNSGDEINEGI